MWSQRVLTAVAVGALLTGLSGCAGSAGNASSPSARAAASAPGSSPAATSSGAPVGTITVDAAASLNRVFPLIARRFEAEHPGATVRFSFGGSADLAAEIVSGAPVDVFAAASTKTMATVTAAKRAAATPVVIARNRLEIAVPKGNPGHITGLADFGDAAKTVVICAPAVPCGAAAKQVFALARVTPKPDSEEQSVTAVLTKVENTADAGLVYTTDVLGAGGRVQGIGFPQADRAITSYPIAPLAGSTHAALAAAFSDYVVRHGAADLRRAGFLGP